MGRIMLGHQGDEEAGAYLAATTIVPLTRATVTDKRKLGALFAKARKDGFAVIEQELEFGLWSLAVPIFDRGGAAPAAIGVSVHDLHMTRKTMLERFLERLRAASREISAALPT
jgi:IclR family pca regulon transcriptional regulator